MAVALSVWPIFTLAVAVLLGIAVLAWRAPAWAFVAALAIFGTEGWLKGMLFSSGVPFAGHEVAAGAALVDLALILGVAGLLFADRGEPLLSLWRRLDRLTRVGIALLGAWLTLSLFQVFQNGSFSRGIDGFRLTQAYLVVAAAGALLLSRRIEPGRLVTGMLVGLGAITSYAALRALVGPSNTERWFALSRPGPTQYGDVFRAVGSFSGAVGLASFVVPAGVFAYGLALLSPRHRALAACVFVTAAAATVGSYSRAGLVGLGFGVVLVTAIALRTAFAAPRRRRIAYLVVLGVLAVGAAATVLAGRVSPVTEARTSGIADPFGDASTRMRAASWRRSLDEIRHHPLGTGVGTVGSASGVAGGSVIITDNSFLKVAREQGIEGVLLFIAGLTTLGAAIARRIGSLSPGPRAIAASALGGVGAFLVLCIFGEFIEQPGKVVAWTLLGLAVSSFVTSPTAVFDDQPSSLDRATASVGARASRLLAWLATVPLGLRILWAIGCLALVGGSSALALLRTPTYTASVEAFAGTRSAADRNAYLRKLAKSPLVPQQAPSGIPYPLDGRSIVKHVHLRPTSRSVAVSVTADSSFLATAIDNGVAVALANASARDVGARAAAQLVKARRSLALAHSRAARARLKRRIAHLRKIVASPPADVAIGPRPDPPPPRGRLDKLLARLPGVLPPRPSPVTTSLVGALVALMFCFVSYVYCAFPKRVPELDASMSTTTSRKLSVP